MFQRTVPILLSLTATLLLTEAYVLPPDDYQKLPAARRRFVDEYDEDIIQPAYRDPHIIDTLPRKPQKSRRTESDDLSLEEKCELLQQKKAEGAIRRHPGGSSWRAQATRRGASPLLNIADKGLEFGKSMLYLPSLLFEPNAEVAKNPTNVYQDRYVISTA